MSFARAARKFPYGQRGLTVLELIVAVAIVVLIATSVFTAVHASLLAQRALTLNRRAVLVAEEGVAVARYDRDADWATFAARPLVTDLYPTFSGGSATLSTTDPGAVDGVFARTVVLSSVYRDGNGNIDPLGPTLDEDARGVSVTVSWTDQVSGAQSIVFDLYLMKP